MKSSAEKAVAIVGVGAVLPGAPNARKFWQNIKEGVYSITEVNADRWNPALYYEVPKTFSRMANSGYPQIIKLVRRQNGVCTLSFVHPAESAPIRLRRPARSELIIYCKRRMAKMVIRSISCI